MIGRVLALAIGLMSGLAGAQLPEFAQQYRRRLGGAIDELRRIVSQFDDTARQNGLTRDQSFARLEGNADPVVQAQGRTDREVVARLGRLEDERATYDGAGPFGRLVVFVRSADPSLARATYLDYEPAWPATSEGLTAGGIGFVVGWAVLLFGARIVRRLTPTRRPRRAGRLRSA